MNNLIFLYKENGYSVSKLNLSGFRYFIIVNNATGKRYIRKCSAAVNEIIRNSIDITDRAEK